MREDVMREKMMVLESHLPFTNHVLRCVLLVPVLSVRAIYRIV